MRISLREKVGGYYTAFWNCHKRYRAIIGGRDAKKSVTEALWIIHHMMALPGSNTLVVRKIYKDHKDSTFAQLNWAINHLGVQDAWESRQSPLEIILKPTGQKILFRGLDDPMSITSITVSNGYLCWCWMEEAYQIASEQDFDMIDGSLRGKVPDHLFPQITLTLNPWNERHWIKKRFFDNPDEQTFISITNYLMNEFKGTDDIRYFEEMKVKNPRRYQVEGLGNWGVSEGLVFDNWEEKEFDYHKIIKDRDWIESAFGLDFGYTVDPTGLLCSLVDTENKEIFIFDEHYAKGLLNNEIAEVIKYKGYAKETIIADSAEPKSIDEIKGYGIQRIEGARKGKDSISNGIQFLQQFKIYIHPKCTNTILEFNNYAWNTKGGHLVNEPIDEYNHLIDPLRYSVERFMEQEQFAVLFEA